MTDLFAPSETSGALTVTEVNRLARSAVEGALGAVWVHGEITGLKAYSSGHWYFGIKDAESQLRCVMWRAHASKMKGQPAEGTQVYCLGTPTVWEERGEYRLNVTRMLQLDQLGGQALELERVRKLLAADGLFDPGRKRPLPPFARTIGVVTSLNGAALRDVITVARGRWPSIRIIAFGAAVQGASAESEVVAALKQVDRLGGVDVCIVGRGGGSKEDLDVFNKESVCRALAALRCPTISAVGHETDVALTDLVADVRAATPSAAAELAVPDRRRWVGRADDLATRLARALERRGQVARERLYRSADRMQAALQDHLRDRKTALERYAVQLDALSPLKVLGRGYAVAQDEQGKVLKSVKQLKKGTEFTLRVSDGAVDAKVS
ncbi:MAG TPA: exodeoxyribonuclease VII large subunit [Gemmatimonadales bacterium]|nr:exodeoxyribonuclease VII large subunit [Gemmatimonadales bacterium]